MLNHSIANNSETNGNKINCQMNNLLEEDEDELEGEKIDDSLDSKKESKANGAHLSTEAFSESEPTQNGTFHGMEQPPILLINCSNRVKTETCI